MALEQIDQTITLLINSHHCSASDAFWSAVSGVWIWVPLYALIIGLMFWSLGWKKALAMVLATAVTVLLTDQLCTLIKDSVCRLRPANDPVMLERGLYLPCGASKRHIYGFLSAHAANCFAVTTCSAIFLREDKRLSKAWWGSFLGFMILWAGMVSISRVFLAKHFVGDILAGALFGCAIAAAISYLTLYLYKLKKR